jgi:integration host factor subunit alpha
MTKAEIVQSLYDRVSGFSKKECADVVELVFSLMKDTLAKGDKIKVSGFGNFLLRDKQERPGRNPKTGSPINISPRRVLTFKASQILRHNLNKGAKNASSKGAADPTASHLGK